MKICTDIILTKRFSFEIKSNTFEPTVNQSNRNLEERYRQANGK